VTEGDIKLTGEELAGLVEYFELLIEIDQENRRNSVND
jgi:hypothetical protein